MHDLTLFQLITSGDFFQLPPCTRDPTTRARYAFESPKWLATTTHFVNLTTIYRQTNLGTC